jgi:hypothetical protein
MDCPTAPPFGTFGGIIRVLGTVLDQVSTFSVVVEVTKAVLGAVVKVRKGIVREEGPEPARGRPSSKPANRATRLKKWVEQGGCVACHHRTIPVIEEEESIGPLMRGSALEKPLPFLTCNPACTIDRSGYLSCEQQPYLFRSTTLF